jgi:hypothetical protein
MDRISHWEKGIAVPSLGNLFKLSVIYKATPQELYEEFYKLAQASVAQDAAPIDQHPPDD